jgi:hypothetical protein
MKTVAVGWEVDGNLTVAKYISFLDLMTNTTKT